MYGSRKLARRHIMAGITSVAALVALAGCAGQSTGKAVSTATATLIPIPTQAPSPWHSVTDISAVASIAPAQFRILYDVFSGQTSKTTPPAFYIRRSDDYGKTYHDLTPPPIPGGANPTNVLYMSGDESPLTPTTYYLTVQIAGSCGVNRYCQIQYVTTDSGATWTQLTLPAKGILGVSGPSGATSAQGQRLYGSVNDIILNASGVEPPGRLVSSGDGGVTWTLADAPIAAAGQWIYNYAVGVNGSTIAALAGPTNANQVPGWSPPLTLWTSNDGGATWKNRGAAPGSVTLGIRVAADPASGLAILYYMAFDSSQDIHLYASRDGGATWPATYDFHSSRELNMPNAYPGPVVALPDGSVLIANFDFSMLKWNPTLATPQTALPPPPNVGFVRSEITQPLDSAHIRLWLTSQDSQGKMTYFYVTLPQ